MLSRKSKDKSIHKDGVVGKYVKRDTPPEIPSEYQLAAEAAQTLLAVKEWGNGKLRGRLLIKLV